MRPDSTPPDDTLPPVRSKSKWPLSGLLIALVLAAAAALIMIPDYCHSVSNALEVQQHLTAESAESIPGLLRYFLQHACRWIFKACG